MITIMDGIAELGPVILSASAKKDPQRVIGGLKSIRDWRKHEICGSLIAPSKEIPIAGEIRERVEGDIGLAKSVLMDIGYSGEEADQRLPQIDQIHFYQSGRYSDSVSGRVANEGGRLEVELSSFVSAENWQRIGPIMVHELGHYPAQRVYGQGAEANSPIRLISFGLDRKKRHVRIMGTQYFQTDMDDTYMNGVLREPLADLFGYYSTEKRSDGTAYHAHKYYRETAFVIALLEKLSEIRGTQFFEEFARMYRSFNERDYKYFVTIRDDFAKQWREDGLPEDEAMKKATSFVSSLNRIQSKSGLDCIQTGIDGDPAGIHIVNSNLGGQITKVATAGDFNDKLADNVRKINGEGLVLPNASTVMTRDVNR